MVDKLLSLGADVHKVDDLQTMCLAMAAGNKNEAIFDRILDRWDRDTDQVGMSGSTALAYAAFNGNTHATEIVISRRQFRIGRLEWQNSTGACSD